MGGMRQQQTSRLAVVVVVLGLLYGVATTCGRSADGLPVAGLGGALAAALLKAAPVWVLAGTTRPRLIRVGLLLSSFADIALELDSYLVHGAVPPIPQTEICFVVGLAAFLLAHCCYIAEFAAKPGGAAAGPLGLAMYAVGGVLIAALWDGVPEELQLPVCLYTVAIATMAYCAIGGAQAAVTTATAAGSSTKNTGDATRVAVAECERQNRHDAMMGALAFVVSDSLLAVGRFIPQAVAWRGQITVCVMVTYYLAQLKIAQSGGAM
mmetsp:Transcript_30308/g.79546  ORF Transcript_30308/g.79546 Transcript_30308/m.79546 type:complete len:266 (-) Transcript_30308:74-871(-)